MIHFTKMQGIGNDYIYVDASREKISDPHELARRISDRHFGVGSDGLVLILPASGEADQEPERPPASADGRDASADGPAAAGCAGHAPDVPDEPPNQEAAST